MKIHADQLEPMLHQLRSGQQVLANFIRCLDEDIKARGGELDFVEFSEYCSIIIQNLSESKRIIGKVKKAALKGRKVALEQKDGCL